MAILSYPSVRLATGNPNGRQEISGFSMIPEKTALGNTSRGRK